VAASYNDKAPTKRFVPWERHVDRLENWHKQNVDGRFDADALEVLRARITEAHGITTAEVDLMSLQDVADVLERMTPPRPNAVGALPPIGSMPSKQLQDPMIALLRVYTNGLVDDRIKAASQVLSDDTLTANEKLTEIDELIRIPATASAEQLGKMLGVTKQAVLRTEWWTNNRRGEKANAVGRRGAVHRERAEEYEEPDTRAAK
jgi:hypothetical protein